MQSTRNPTRTSRPTRPELNVLDFGARGDGRAVDGDAVRNALRALPEDGGRIRFPDGYTFLLDSVEIDRAGVTLIAAGAKLVKAPEPVGHIFFDTRGRADDFRCVGGTFDMRRDSFQPGQTVSPFFFVRNLRLSFEGISVHSGIEEGIKLYKCQDVQVLACDFRDVRNNGIQLHAPARDGFGGTRPDQDARGLRVVGCRFSAIDDGLEGLGDGIGVAVHGTSRTVTVRDVEVSGCTVEDSVRGLWAEFNTPGNPGRNIWFHHNTVRRAHYHGIGLVGVHDGAIRENRIYDTGRTVPDPPRSSDYAAAVIVSGSRGVVSRAVTVERNDIQDRRPAASRHMQYGIVLTRGEALTVRDVDRVRGATIAPLHIPDPDLVSGEIDGKIRNPERSARRGSGGLPGAT